jgi:hypothetical protein
MGRHTAAGRRLSMSVTSIKTDAALLGSVGVEVALSLFSSHCQLQVHSCVVGSSFYFSFYSC